MTEAHPSGDAFTDRGRPIYGPTPPGGARVWPRTSDLSHNELASVVDIIATARRARTSAVLPDGLRSRSWQSVADTVLALDEALGWDGAGWKVGAAGKEVQSAEGVPGPSPGRLFRRGLVSSGDVVPAELFVNYRECECEFAFRMAADFPPRGDPYSEEDVAAGTGNLVPVIEVGDSVFEDWYAASGYFGPCYDNGGGAALIMGEDVTEWRHLDLSTASIDLSVNGHYIKSGTGAAAMGTPLTSLTWLVNWLRERDRYLYAGDLVSTGTCTGHCFVAPGDEVVADFGALGLVTARFA